MKFMMFVILLCSFISCENEEEKSELAKRGRTQFATPVDPCQESERCTDFRQITYQQAIEMSKELASEPPVGNRIVRDYEDTLTMIVREGEGYRTVQCAIKYRLEKLLVDFDTDAVYFEEKKSEFEVNPDNEICRDYENYREYQPVIVAKESRSDFEITDPDSESEEIFRNMKIERFKLDGVPVLRISGVFTLEFDVEGEVVKSKNSLYSLFSLGETIYDGIVASHTINKFSDGEKYEQISHEYVLTKDQDVSHIDITNMSEEEIVDRTWDGSYKLQKRDFQHPWL